MTYVELLNKFWAEFSYKPTSGEAMLYLYLLHQYHLIGEHNPFKAQTDFIAKALNVTRKNIIELRAKLKKDGLLDYLASKSPGPTLYFLTDVDINDDFVNAPTITARLQLGDELLPHGNSKPPQLLPCGDSKGDELLPHGNSKPPQLLPHGNSSSPNEGGTHCLNNNINISGNIYSTYIGNSRKRSLLAPEQKQQMLKFPKDKKPKSQKEVAPPPTPTLDQVKSYFLEHGKGKKIDNLEECAQAFFDYFNSVGWRDRYNRSIQRWDSRANNWMLDEEKRQAMKKSSPYANNETDRFSERRGTEPTSAQRKNFHGTF